MCDRVRKEKEKKEKRKGTYPEVAVLLVTGSAVLVGVLLVT